MDVTYVMDVQKAMKDEVLGQRIVEVRWQTEEEMAEMMWEQRGVVLILENGHSFVVARDEECNGPGALLTSLPGAAAVLAPLV
jgi:hypothetical protein